MKRLLFFIPDYLSPGCPESVLSVAVIVVGISIKICAVMGLYVGTVIALVAMDIDISGCGLGACKEGSEKDCCCDEFLHILLLCQII